MDMIFLYSLLLGYLFGAIPFGLVLCYLFGYGDVRNIGSGNIGATNVLRTGNKALAFLTFVLDSGKGAIPILLALFFVQDLSIGLVGLGAVLGHNFPVWLKFKGGKGISTTFGTIAMLSWPVGLAAFVVWISVAVVSRISSLSALVTAFLTPLFSVLLGNSEHLMILTALSVLVFVRHHENIRRLLKGQESKISFKGRR